MTKSMANSNSNRSSRETAIRIWLIVVAAFVVATLLVGGATRLTESGLSITEWKPVTGTLPPLNDAQWQDEFAKYQSIPQYWHLNAGMTLAEFKTIFWWEWAHRLLGRSIGAVFLLPFAFFLWRGWIGHGLRWKLWTLFALGGVQGAVGWWMVSSGLSERVSVSQYRLAFHMTLACAIYAGLVWTLRGLRPAAKILPVPARIRRMGFVLLFLLLAQIYLGALVAGLDAGLVYNTWPLIDGAFIPAAERLWFLIPLWRNFFENDLAVQFLHRMAAYLLLLFALGHAFDIARHRRDPAVFAGAIVLLLILQAAIGIATLLAHVPLPLALLHQGMAIVILTMMTLHAETLARGRAHEGFATAASSR